MFLFVFAEAKWRSGKIAKFQFLIPANWGAATFSLQKVPERAGDSGVFLTYFAVQSPDFELKQNLEGSHTLKWTLNHLNGWKYFRHFHYILHGYVAL